MSTVYLKANKSSNLNTWGVSPHGSFFDLRIATYSQQNRSITNDGHLRPHQAKTIVVGQEGSAM